MTPQQFKDRLYVSVKRGDTTEVRVGIRLEAILTIDSDKEEDIEAATEQGRNDIVNGVYGGTKETLRVLLNELIGVQDDDVRNAEAIGKLVLFQETL